MIIIVYIAYILSLLVIIPLLYISYCMFTGKPLFINCFLLCLMILAYFAWHPFRFTEYITQIRDFSPDAGFPLTYYISPLLFQTFIFLLLVVFFMFTDKDNYCFFNTQKDSKAIAEKALKNLGISFESLEKSSKINENTFLYYLTRGFLRWKYVYINFSEIKDKELRKQIIQEIRNIMYAYKEPNSRILGFLLLSLFAFYIYEAIGALLSLF